MARRDRPLTLDDLPLFATDAQIAEAVVGPDRAGDFLKTLPTLEGRGFPPRSETFGGRYVPLVREYFEGTVRGVTTATRQGVAVDRPEGTWNAPKSKRRA